MNCELIYFVCGVIQYASLHRCSSILCTNSLYVLLDNSQNISSSLLPVSLYITSEGELLTNFGISITHCLIWTFVCTKTPCSLYSGSDGMMNLNQSNQYIFRNLIGCDYAVDFQELFQIPSEILTAPLLLNCKLCASSLYTICGRQKCWNILFKWQATFSAHQPAEHKMNLVRWFV
jgi:hypothetical protein